MKFQNLSFALLILLSSSPTLSKSGSNKAVNVMAEDKSVVKDIFGIMRNHIRKFRNSGITASFKLMGDNELEVVTLLGAKFIMDSLSTTVNDGIQGGDDLWEMTVKLDQEFASRLYSVLSYNLSYLKEGNEVREKMIPILRDLKILINQEDAKHNWKERYQQNKSLLNNIKDRFDSAFSKDINGRLSVEKQTSLQAFGAIHLALVVSNTHPKIINLKEDREMASPKTMKLRKRFNSARMQAYNSIKQEVLDWVSHHSKTGKESEITLKRFNKMNEIINSLEEELNVRYLHNVKIFSQLMDLARNRARFFLKDKLEETNNLIWQISSMRKRYALVQVAVFKNKDLNAFLYSLQGKVEKEGERFEKYQTLLKSKKVYSFFISQMAKVKSSEFIPELVQGAIQYLNITDQDPQIFYNTLKRIDLEKYPIVGEVLMEVIQKKDPQLMPGLEEEVSKMIRTTNDTKLLVSFVEILGATNPTLAFESLVVNPLRFKVSRTNGEMKNLSNEVRIAEVIKDADIKSVSKKTKEYLLHLLFEGFGGKDSVGLPNDQVVYSTRLSSRALGLIESSNHNFFDKTIKADKEAVYTILELAAVRSNEIILLDEFIIDLIKEDFFDKNDLRALQKIADRHPRVYAYESTLGRVIRDIELDTKGKLCTFWGRVFNFNR